MSKNKASYFKKAPASSKLQPPLLTIDEYSALITLLDHQLHNLNYQLAKPPLGLNLVTLARLSGSLKDQIQVLLKIKTKLENGAVYVA